MVGWLVGWLGWGSFFVILRISQNRCVAIVFTQCFIWALFLLGCDKNIHLPPTFIITFFSLSLSYLLFLFFSFYCYAFPSILHPTNLRARLSHTQTIRHTLTAAAEDLFFFMYSPRLIRGVIELWIGRRAILFSPSSSSIKGGKKKS